MIYKKNFLPNNIWNMKRVAVWCAMVSVGINSKKFWVHKLVYQKYLKWFQRQLAKSADKKILRHNKVRCELVDEMFVTVAALHGIRNTCSKQRRCCLARLGVQIRNMKMDFNTGGTWRRVGQWPLMMKIYDFFLFGKVIIKQ